MEFNNMINELFIQFPVLSSVYEDEGDHIENLQHLTYGIVFVPFIRQSVCVNDQNAIRRICDFMECMAGSDDSLVSELLAVSVLESMLSERELINSLKQYLGTETLNILSVMEKEYGWESLNE